MEKLKEFTGLMVMLAKGFGEELDEEQMELYFRCLQDIPLSKLKRGVLWLLRSRTRKGFPTIAEIREAVVAEEEAELRFQAVKAWESVTKQVIGIGYYGKPKLDPIAKDCVELLGGWRHLCDMEKGELRRLSKQFQELYIEKRREGITFAGKLPGRVYGEGC